MPLRPQQGAFIAYVRRLPDAEILRLLDDRPRSELRLIQRYMAPEECDCDLVPVPCECGLQSLPLIACDCGAADEHPHPCPRCGMEPEWLPCEHYKSYYLSEPILMRLEELLYEEPPPPARVDYSFTREARAVTLAKRHRAGKALWHPGDFVHWDVTSDVADRIERPAWTLSGFKKAGEPADELAEAPPANGDVVPGKLRIRMAA